MPFNIADFPETLELPIRVSSAGAWVGLIPLVPIIVKLLKPRTFVELGTHQGDSYTAFCHSILKFKTETRCTAVDSWSGDGHTGGYGPEILSILKEFHDPRFGAFSKLLQSTFDNALPQFADGSIDLLHIDGLHTYEAVKHDYESWLPKASDRGVIIFHDTAERIANFGVWKLWEEIAPTRPSYNFPFGHGLGMLAHGKHVPQDFLDFMKALPDHLMLFEALAGRNEFMKNSYCAGEALHSCQSIANDWRRQTNQQIRNPTPAWPFAWQQPSLFGPPAVQDVLQLGRDAVTLLKEVQELRKSAPQR